MQSNKKVKYKKNNNWNIHGIYIDEIYIDEIYMGMWQSSFTTYILTCDKVARNVIKYDKLWQNVAKLCILKRRREDM